MGLRRLYRSSPRLRRAFRQLKNGVAFGLFGVGLGAVRRLSLPQALAVADRIGDVLYFTLRGTRRLALGHIELALGDVLAPPDRARVVRASFRNIARCFCEVAKFDEIRPQLDTYVDIEGWQHVAGVLAAGRGAIAITGHIGNWELLGAYFAHRGVPVAAIARRVYEPRLNQFMMDFRARNGVQTILRESPSASRDMLRILRDKGVLAMLIDQDTHVPSVSVPFFGHLARTPAAAAALAVRRDLPVLAVFARRRPQGGHHLTILPLSAPRTGERKPDIVALTEVFNQTLESRIRDNPAEWVWWHRRWRHEPMPDLDLDLDLDAERLS